MDRDPNIGTARPPADVRRLDIGLVAPGYATPTEPGLPAVTDLVARLAAKHHIRLVALRHPSSDRPYTLDGVTVHPLGAGTSGGPAGRARLLASAVGLVRRLHETRPFDVLHALWADEAGAVAVAAARTIRVPVVVSVLGGELVALPDIGYGTALGRGGRWTVDVSLRGADVVTVGSSTLREAVAGRIGAGRIAVMPLGVDPAIFSPGPPPGATAARTVVHVASLEPVKDQVTLLRAFARVAPDHRDARLVICGDGSLRRALERLGVQLAIDDAVEFRGHVAREGLPAIYRSAALVCVPSRWEAQSMVAVEAASCGVPVVGTRVGCLPDLGEAARTVPVGDHIALAETIGAMLGDAAMRRRMGTAGRTAAIDRYDLDASVGRWTETYRRLAG